MSDPKQPRGVPVDPENGGAASPGDEAPAGTPGTGENVCPLCRGSGEAEGGRCPACGGTGKVTEGIGGG